MPAARTKDYRDKHVLLGLHRFLFLLQLLLFLEFYLLAVMVFKVKKERELDLAVALEPVSTLWYANISKTETTKSFWACLQGHIDI